MTRAPGEYTQTEIRSQPQAWRAALGDLDPRTIDIGDACCADYARIVFTGCGSPYYLALSAAASARELGLAASAVPASEVWLDGASAYARGGRTLLVVLSRSGETTELMRAIAAFRARGDGDVATVTCYPGSTLAGQGDLNLALPSGQERSFAQTRAFTCMQIAALYLLSTWAGDARLAADLARLPDACERVIDQHAALAGAIGADPRLDRYYFLGSGPRFGLANEISLKMKEMSISHSEPFHTLEFRHGPQTMAGDGALITGLIGESAAAQEQAVLDEMRAAGGRAFSIGESGCDADLDSDVCEMARGPLYVVIGQMLAFAHAIAKGLDPDRPHNLREVVRL